MSDLSKITDKTQKNSLAVIALCGATLNSYLAKVNNITSLSPEEEFLLAKAYLEKNDLQAAHKLVLSHLKLVAKIAMSYKNYGFPVPDLISEGNLGLMHAIKKYNPDLGHRLSTYAMLWIKAYIQEYVLKSWSLVKIGTTALHKKLFFGLNKIKKEISLTQARAVNDSDYKKIASTMDVSESDVREMDIRLSSRDLSLNHPINNGDREAENEMIDFIPENRASQEVVLSINQENNIRRKLLSEGMNKLNERELYIFKSRKLKDSPDTLEILSTKFHISKERVRQIENRAFEKVQSSVLQAQNVAYYPQ